MTWYSAFSQTLIIERAGCRRVPALVGLALVASLIALSQSGLSAWVCWPAGMGATLYGAWEMWRESSASSRFVAVVMFAADGGVAIAGTGGPTQAADIRGVWIWPGLAVGISFIDVTGRHRQAILFRDRVPTPDWRRMLVHLRYPDHRLT